MKNDIEYIYRDEDYKSKVIYLAIKIYQNKDIK